MVYIVSACRTPIGKFLGGLSALRAPELGALVIREAIARANIKSVDEVFMGNVLQSGVGQNPARQAALGAKVPVEVPCSTVNMVCGSGMKAIIDGAQSILAGTNHVVVAGGMESMSNAPHLLRNHRTGKKAGDEALVDSIIYDGLWDVYNDFHMGNTGELVQKKYCFKRQDIDAYALESHKKAIKAQKEGRFKDEIVPVKTAQSIVEQDEGPRADTSLEKLGTLKAAFEKDGVVTPGNSSALNDGASALVLASEEAVKKYKLTPLAKLDAFAQSGLAPEWVMLTPIPATKALLEKMGVKLSHFDLIEANEAFAVQMLAVSKDLGIDTKRLNVHGGAIALGHPIGCSGARIVTTLIYALKANKKKTGLATLCMGGGNGLALGITLV